MQIADVDRLVLDPAFGAQLNFLTNQNQTRDVYLAFVIIFYTGCSVLMQLPVMQLFVQT
jgi:hypothetical protein